MRVYSEQEVSQILERAAERQAKAPTPSVGLTLEDLERIGAEVGLDPVSLRAAAAEVDAAGGDTQRRSHSAAHIFVERWAPVALTEDAWDDLVAELQNRFGKSGMAALLPAPGVAGHVDQVGRNREWTHTDGLGVETRVLVSDRGDRVRLRLSQRVGIGTPVTDGSIVGIGLGWIPGVLVGALAVANLDLDGPWVIPLILASMLVTGVLTWYHDHRWRGRMHDRLDALGSDLVDVLAASSAPAAQALPMASAAHALGTPSVSLDALGAPDASTPAPSSARRTRS